MVLDKHGWIGSDEHQREVEIAIDTTLAPLLAERDRLREALHGLEGAALCVQQSHACVEHGHSACSDRANLSHWLGKARSALRTGGAR